MQTCFSHAKSHVIVPNLLVILQIKSRVKEGDKQAKKAKQS